MSAQVKNISPPLIHLDGISKSFGSVQANKNICLDIRHGEVLALLGENGAGKSTLMNILSGTIKPDAGRIFIKGVSTCFTSPAEAIKAGIGMVYQHFKLVKSMTVAQNVLLGQVRSPFATPGKMEQEVIHLSKRYGLEIDPRAKVADLSMGERQRVEILKLLYRDSQVLIFDEPTAVLTPPEAEQLFTALKAMIEQDKAIVFISHKLEEVLSIAHNVAILRQGEVIDSIARQDIASKEELAGRMVGREMFLELEPTPAPKHGTVLELDGLQGRGLHDISFSLQKGEILAVMGVAGNGQKALVEIIAGMRSPEQGTVRLLGEDWQQFFKKPRWQLGLAYIPEDRKGMGTCAELDLIDNVLLTTRQGFASGIFLQKQKALGLVKKIIRRYHVVAAGVGTKAKNLSGGNLQKLVLGREFHRKPQIIVAEQPSQGLDISATEEIWHRLLNARLSAGILLVTGDMDEALQLSDRIAVMFRGRILDIFSVTDKDKVKNIGSLLAGIRPGS